MGIGKSKHLWGIENLREKIGHIVPAQREIHVEIYLGRAKSDPNDMAAQKTIKARSGATARGVYSHAHFS